MARSSGTASAYARRDPYDPEGVSPATVNVCVDRFRVDDDADTDLPDVETYQPLTPYAEPSRKRFSRYDGFNADLHTTTWARPASRAKEPGGVKRER